MKTEKVGKEIQSVFGPQTVIPGMEGAPPYQSYFPHMQVASQLCKGKGIELGGAAHNAFGLPNCANVAPFGAGEEEDFELYKQAQIKLCNYYMQVDIPAEAHHIPDLASGSLDYVISSHVLEHMPNLIAVLLEADRLLRQGGIFFAILPKRDAHPPDAERPITALQHFFDDYEANATVDTHVEPFGYPVARRGHYHVFSLTGFIELVSECVKKGMLNWELIYSEATDSKAGNGFTVVYRKV